MIGIVLRRGSATFVGQFGASGCFRDALALPGNLLMQCVIFAFPLIEYAFITPSSFLFVLRLHLKLARHGQPNTRG